MAKAKVADHLEHGVPIICADGTTITCQPMLLSDARYFMDLWDQAGDDDPGVRVTARISMARRLADLYPDLAAHIGMGDVEVILPAFFWWTSGAHVAGNGKTSTGTPSTPSIAPSTDTPQSGR